MGAPLWRKHHVFYLQDRKVLILTNFPRRVRPSERREVTGDPGIRAAQRHNGPFPLRVPLKVGDGAGGRRICSSVRPAPAGYGESECSSPTASRRHGAKHITAVWKLGSLMRNYLLWISFFLPLYCYCSLLLPRQHAAGPVPPPYSDRHPTDDGEGWRSLLQD